MSPAVVDAALRERLAELCDEGWAIFEKFDTDVRDHRFHSFVAADYATVLSALVQVYNPNRRFLEWGSASGVIAIMADLLGYDACGIEIDASLVRTAEALATRHASAARFVTGSFLPEGYRWVSRDRDGRTGNVDSGRSGYLALGCALEEFDVVFAFPWPGDEAMMLDVMRQYGRPDALMLLYGVTDGVRAYRGGREERLGT